MKGPFGKEFFLVMCCQEVVNVFKFIRKRFGWKASSSIIIIIIIFEKVKERGQVFHLFIERMQSEVMTL